MTKRSWLLTDHATGVSVASWKIEVGDLGGTPGSAVEKRTLQAGLSAGVEVIEVNNGRLRFVVVPTRGMGIWRAAAGSTELRWKSVVNGPVHPTLVRLWEPSGIGWLDGFDELLVRCGLESNGAPEFHANGTLRYPLHGRIANIPAHEVSVTFDAETGEIAIHGVVDEARLFANKLRLTTTISTQLGSPTLTVTDVVSNLAAIDSELEMLYHINVGEPFLAPGATAVLPVMKVAPRDRVAIGNVADWNKYGPQIPGEPEAAFYCELAADAQGRTHTLLRSADGQQGMSLKFNKGPLPCFTLWKNRMPGNDSYVTGFEPGTNYPNVKSYEKSRGRVVSLAPGGSRTFEIELTAHTDAASVVEAAAAVAEIQSLARPQVLDKPEPQWSVE